MEVDENDENISTPILKCELNTLTRADGSSILCQNNTVVAVAIYGPVEVKQHKMLIDKAYVEVFLKPKCGISQIGDRLHESIIGKVCETAILTTFYPRTAINIIIQEVQNSDNILACSINAACLALIHAGIAMNYLFAAVTTSSFPRNNKIIDAPEDTKAEPTITFVFENTSEKILAVESHVWAPVVHLPPGYFGVANRIQWRAALGYVVAYRTVSYEAANLLDGISSIELIVQKRSALY